MTEKRSPFLKNCKICKKDVAIGVKACPHCGAKNPTLTWKDNVAGALLILFIILLLGYCGRQPDPETESEDTKEISEIKQPPTQTTVAEPQASPEVPKATAEEIQAIYDTAQKRATALRELWAALEPVLAVPNQVLVNDDLLTAKKFGNDLSYTAYGENVKPLNTEKEIANALVEMNNALGGAAAAMERRIDRAIELSSGSKNPVKAAEKFSEAREEYERRMVMFEEQGRIISQWLANNMPVNPHSP